MAQRQYVAVPSQTGPFADAADRLHQLGLAVLPCGGPDGKTPAVQWRNWRGTGPGPALIRQHGGANIGILTGRRSGVTVVDIDDPSLLPLMLERFGDTPLITRTPSGGFHLWYRYSGERSGNLRAEGLAVDIKGDGGFVVVPPSVRLSGPNSGSRYSFHSGDWSQISKLPCLRQSGSVGNSRYHAHGVRSVGVGHRNDFLFKQLLRCAPHCDSVEALVDVGQTMVSAHFEYLEEEPFSQAEIRKTAESAWKYNVDGKNWSGEPARSLLTGSHEEFLNARNADAQVLIRLLLRAHAVRPDGTFALCIRALVESGRLAGWGKKRFVAARNCLMDFKFIMRVKRGGRGPGDLDLFMFGPALEKGSQEYLNITTHLSPASVSIAA